MPNLRFKQLLLLSNSIKSANLFEFDKRLTLITADDNSVGKSTLVKLIFWTLGCEPVLDTIWEGLDCRTILKFEVEQTDYEVMRYKGMVALKYGNDIKTYERITGDFSERIASILQFSALLPKRNKIELDCPPPAYYFLPFYIDQKRSWATAWDTFLNLTQYDNWKSTIIKYHIGLLPPRHFNLELDKFLKKNEQTNLINEVKSIETALEVVQSYIPKTTSTLDIVELSNMTGEIQKDLKSLSDKQERLLNELTKIEGDRSFLLHQKQISEKIILELDSDYKYAVENIEGDQIECPLCGTVHENTIINRASILTDKQQAERQLEIINVALLSAEKSARKLNNELDKTKIKIDEINKKYIIEDESQSISLSEIIETIAGRSITEKAEAAKNNKAMRIDSLKKEIASIGKEQKKVITVEEKQAILDSFNLTFASYIQVLNAESVNISGIKSPMDYGKVVREGGAAEGTRAILAYYLTIYSLIQNFGSEVIAPLVIDTPNQQEQSLTNYDKIVDLITKKLDENSQVILCSMNSERLNPIKEKAKVIHLTNNKLLDASKYADVEPFFKKYRHIQ